MKILDLFSGIGGFSLAGERYGMETIAFCETNDYASEVLKKRWPHVPNIKGGVIALNSLLKRARMSSRQDFRVRTFRLPVGAPAYPEPARDSFGHLCEPFAWFDRASRSWRTWQRCLIEDWQIFSGTWPRSGMTRNGIAYRRAPLVRLTKGTASGSLLPTPTARDHFPALPTPRPCSGKRSSGMNRTEIMTALEQWPTPTASLGIKGGRVTPRKGREGGNLIEAIAARQFATPTARDWRSGKASEETMSKNARPLSEQVGGALNPTWVEWLMGFPGGWTDLNASVTPSSRKSRNS